MVLPSGSCVTPRCHLEFMGTLMASLPSSKLSPASSDHTGKVLHQEECLCVHCGIGRAEAPWLFACIAENKAQSLSCFPFPSAVLSLLLQDTVGNHSLITTLAMEGLTCTPL